MAIQSLDCTISGSEPIAKRFMADRQSLKEDRLRRSLALKPYMASADVNGSGNAPTVTTEARRIEAQVDKFDANSVAGRIKAQARAVMERGRIDAVA